MLSSRNDPSRTELISTLEELLNAEIEFILVGGLAAVVQGAPITTMDVDILYHATPANISKLLNFLKSMDAIYRRPDDKVIHPKEDDFSTMGQRLFTTRLGPIDVLAFIEENKTYEDLIEHSVEIEFRGHILHVLDLKILVDLKKASNDPKDKQRLPVLEETLRQKEKN